ncbi:MAG: hypothetical protein OEZ13_08210 [Spirochaetia bacterium]|nr:hypothetical protein [Spirochaetia bacterium]
MKIFDIQRRNTKNSTIHFFIAFLSILWSFRCNNNTFELLDPSIEIQSNDNILPVLSVVTISSNNVYSASSARTGDTVTLNITASEALSGAPVVTIAGNTAAVSGIGPYTATYIMTGTETEGVIPFTIDFNDAAGNAGIQVTTTTDLSGVTYYVPAVITNVTSTAIDGAYKAGTSIPIQIIFDQIVVVDTTFGFPAIGLDVGTIIYSGGTGTNTLEFNYAVNTGDTSSRLKYTSAAALTLNSSTIADISGNPVDLTLPIPGTIGSLNFNKNFVIDTTLPTVYWVTSSLTPDATYGLGNIVYVEVVFSEPVIISGLVPKLTLETGASDAIIDYFTGSHTSALVFKYTVQTDHQSVDLDYKANNSLSLAGSFIKDVAGNNANLVLPNPGETDSLSANKNIVIDGIVPVISSVTSVTPNGSYKEGDIVSIQVNFSHAVDVTSVPALKLNTGATVNYASGSGTNSLTFDYTVNVGDTTGDLSYAAPEPPNPPPLSLSGGSTIKKSTGAANNANLTLPPLTGAGSLSTAKDIIIDTTAPVISSITSTTPSASYGAGSNINVTVTMSEPVTLSGGTLDVTLDTGAVVSITAGSYPAAVLTGTYTVLAGDSSGDLDSTAISLSSGTLQDAAGNSADLTLPLIKIATGSAIVIDTAVPAITNVTSIASDGYYKAGSFISVNVTFSEVVDVTGTPVLALNSAGSASYSGGTGTTTLTFDYTVGAGQNSSDLDYSATNSLTGGTIVKSGGGASANLTLPPLGEAGSLGFNKDIIVDTTVPVINSITSSTADGTYGLSAIINITVSMSEPVTLVTGPLNVTLETGTTDRTVSISAVSYPATILTGTYTVMTNDTSADLTANSVALGAGTLQDEALNNANLALPVVNIADGSEIVINTTPLTVQFSAPVSSSNIENITALNIPVELSSTSASSTEVCYSVTGGTAAAVADFTIPASPLVIPPGSLTGNIPITINNDATDENDETIMITLDIINGASCVALDTNMVYTYTITDDDAAPNVFFAASSSATLDESAGAQNVTVNLSAVSGKTVNVDVTQTGGTAASGTDYTFTSPTTLTFTPGVTSLAASYIVSADTDIEGDETIIFGLNNFVNASLGAISSHTATITDDDGSPTLSVLDAFIVEGNSGSSQAVITVNMAGVDAGSSVTVDYAASNGTAVLSDYTAASGTLTWAPGETGSKTFNITVYGDTLGETNETVIITLSNVSANAAIVDATGILTINNDDVTLTVVSAETLDCDPVNGLLDHYRITFSEPVTDSTFDGYLANAEGAVTSKWLIASHAGVRLDHGTALNAICDTDTPNDNVVYVKYSESTSVNTGVLPELTTSFATVTAVSGIGKLYYNTGNILSTDIIETDTAKPYVWYSLASHYDGGIDGSAGANDKLEIRYSESTNAPNLSGVDLDTIFLLNNTHDFGTASDIASVVWGNTSYTNDTLTVTFASDLPTVYDGDTIKAIGSTVSDLAGNLPQDTADVLSPPAIVGTFDGGAKGPVVISAEYRDLDSNGFIDHVKITFDKVVDETTFPGYVANNQINNVTTVWQVAGYNNVALDTSDSLNADPIDNIIWLTFSESSDYDTGAKPDLTATPGAAGLRDATDNCYINTSPLDCLDSTKAQLLTADVSEKDAAVPIVTMAAAKEDDRLLFVWFSENVWSDTGMPACGSGGQLNAGDFAYNDINTGGASLVASLDFDNCGADDGFVRLLTNNLFVLSDIQNDQIGAAAGEIFDAAGNNMSGGVWYTIVETTAPYLLTASSYYDTIGLTYWLRLVFSEPMESVSATTASNYILSVDSAGSCSAINAVPHSVRAVSNTIYDLETDPQCSDTVYKIFASNNIYNANQIEPVSAPNEATTIGTGSLDTTLPRLIQALSLSSTSVQLTFSEPMRLGDQLGSAECSAAFVSGATCVVDVDTTVPGSQALYTLTPSLGTVLSVSVTSDPSVFILTHNDVQYGSFYTVTPYANNGVAYIPQDIAGNNLSPAPENRATFQGNGTIIDDLGEGSLFVDPFADGTSFSFAFNYQKRIYLGPNDENSGAFRFEADGSSPIMTIFLAGGSVCAGTGTFGFGTSPSVCNVDLGPNGERGIVGFNSGTISAGGEDFEILMVGPLKDGVGHTYFTNDIDTTLNWTGCAFSATGGANTKSVQTAFALGDSYYAGLSSNQGTQAPILVRQKLINSGGVLTCGAASDLSVRTLADFGKGGNNLKNTPSIVGVDSMAYVPAGTINANSHFYMANNGALYAWDISANGDEPNTTGTWTKVFAWSAKDPVNPYTLVLPSLEKIRPGEKGVPFIQKWNNALYIARNITSVSGGTTSSGAQLWKCTSVCNTSAGWFKVADSNSFIDASTGGVNNISIGLFQVNKDSLYLGFDNVADGVIIYKSNTAVTEIDVDNSGNGETDFTIQDKAGLSDPIAYKYLFSSSSLDKQGKHYIYITVGDSFDAIKVIRQVD